METGNVTTVTNEHFPLADYNCVDVLLVSWYKILISGRESFSTYKKAILLGGL